MKLFFYRLFLIIFYPFIVVYLWKRRSKGKEDASYDRFQERFGKASLERPEGKLIWFLCASVGESMSILPLIEDMKAQDSSLNFLITTTTVASANILKKKMPEYCIHQYVPVDVPFCVNRFFKHWEPDVLLNVDSEIWPNLILKAKKRKIRMGIINARMNKKSFGNWMKNLSLAKKIFPAYSFAISADNSSSMRFRKLGVNNVKSYGNIKNAYSLKLPKDEDVIKFKKIIGDRKFFVSSSTHPAVEEEKEVFKAFKKVLKKHKDALLILSPRHINFGKEIKKWAEEEFGFETSLRSEKEDIKSSTNVYVADTMGESNLWYFLADIVFVGGSMHESLGGHNPMEPAYMDCVLSSGRYVKTFKKSFDDMDSAGFLTYVDTSDDLAKFVLKCFDDEKFVEDSKKKASKFMAEKSKIRTYLLEDVMKNI